jgi:adenosyl cobinamide kinase/adenosyl cobinamide phosphate guanylyltransferase
MNFGALSATGCASSGRSSIAAARFATLEGSVQSRADFAMASAAQTKFSRRIAIHRARPTAASARERRCARASDPNRTSLDARDD